MKAWRENQQRGKVLAVCRRCNEKIYTSQPSRVIYTQPVTFEHRDCRTV